MDHSRVSSDGDDQDPGHSDSEHESVVEAVRSLLLNHDRMNSERRHCLLVTIHEATSQGCRALLKLKWTLANIADVMWDDLNVTEAVILDHITAILYVGRWSAGEGLTEEEAGACIDHFSPYIEWREVAIEREFQALTLAEAHEEIHAYEATNHKSLRGQLKATKPPYPGLT